MREIPIVLLGHKDHGKSTLIGRLLLDSKSIKESRLKEIQEVDAVLGKKFELAHLTDSFREEREREMTMDTTRALLKRKEINYQLIDVPGHKELISQMLTGASAAEAALLLVSITEGIKDQTRRHLEIVKLLGIEQLGVVINKIDKVGYQKTIFDEIAAELGKILNKIGYSPKNIRFFPVSASEGDNVIRKSDKTAWYKGPTLMNFLEKEIKLPESFTDLPLSFIVQDVYSEGGKEILVGPVETGTLRKGQEILFLPDNEKSKIESINDSDGMLEEAEAGQNVGICLSKNFNLPRGTVITSLNSDLKAGNILAGEIFCIEKPSQENLILECATAQVEGKFLQPKVIDAMEKKPYKFLLKKPIAFAPRSKGILGKIVLKEKGNIIAVGNIL